MYTKTNIYSDINSKLPVSDENQIQNTVPNITHKYKLRKRDENMNIAKVANKVRMN